jgi:UDP-N-acetylmuramoylalanine--D-glutamate ligase
MLYGLREYRGEPHRVEPVGMVREVEYFDDSKGTNVGATVAALTGLGADRRLVVILGGDGKARTFAAGRAGARYARAVLLIGRDAPQIRAALAGSGVPLLDAATLPEAVQLAASAPRPATPCCCRRPAPAWTCSQLRPPRAVFVDAVRALAEDAGQSLDGGLA